MFGLPVQDSTTLGDESDEEHQHQQQEIHHEPSPAANGAPLKEKWCADPAFCLPPAIRQAADRSLTIEQG